MRDTFSKLSCSTMKLYGKKKIFTNFQNHLLVNVAN
jgi:hypothetical protein